MTTLHTEGLGIVITKLNSKGAVGLLTMIPKLILGLKQYGISAIWATLTTEGFSAACKMLNISPVMLGITALVAVFAGLYFIVDACSTTTEEYAEKLEKSGEELNEITSKLKNLNSELTTTKERINELESKDSLTVVEQAELDKLKETNAELKRQISLVKKKKQTKAIEVSEDFANTVTKWKDDTTGGTLLVAGGASISGNAATFDSYDVLKYYFDEYNNTQDLDEKESIYKQLSERYSKLAEYKEKIEDIDYEHLTTEAKTAYDYIFDFENKLLLMSGNAEDIQTVFNSIYSFSKYSEAKQALEELGEQGSITANQLWELSLNNQNFKDMITYISELGIADFTLNANPIESYKKIAEYLNGSAEEIENTNSGIIKSFEELATTIDNIQKSYNIATTAIKEYNETGYLSIDNLQSLLELDDKYLKSLIDENGQLVANTDAYKQLIFAELQELELQQVEAVLKSVSSLSLESAQAYITAQAIDIENESRQSLIETMITQAMTEARLKNNKEGTTAYTDAIQASLPLLAKRIALIRQTEKAVADEAKSTTESLSRKKEVFEKQLNNLEEAKTNIQDLIDLVTDMITKEKELEKEVLEKQKDDFDKIIEKRKEALNLQKEELEINRELADKQNEVAKNALNATIVSLDDSGVGQKAQKEANDNLAESRSDLKDYLANREFDIRTENLEKLQENTEKFYDNEIKVIDKYLNDERQLYEDACRLIDEDNGILYDNLLNYVRTYTTKSDSELQHLWSSASTAIGKYGGKNVAVSSLINILNDDINTTQATIDNLDDKISETAKSIETIANAIGSSLSGGIDNAKISLEEYNKVLEELKKYTNTTWEYTWGDDTFISHKANRTLAAQDISAQIYKELGKDIPYTSLYAHMKKIPQYARGTSSAKGGLSIVGEKGAELRVLNSGDGIIPADITANLMSIGKNPSQYFKVDYEKIFSLLSSSSMMENTLNRMFGEDIRLTMPSSENYNQTIAPAINITIQGDATQSTVDALKAEANKIIRKATDNIMNIALKNKRII